MIERPESTLAALQRAIELGADVVEIDVRTSKDGHLFLLHDATLDRTTDGTGVASELTMRELKQLDAGTSFGEAYRGERIPTLAEALELCRGKIDVLLDLKEQGTDYARAVARDVTAHGDAGQTILGVRSTQQARLLRRLLPSARQLGFIASPNEIDAYAEAGVDAIRLWPRWLQGHDASSLVTRVHAKRVRLYLNGKTGTPQEILPLLRLKPAAILVDDPATMHKTLQTAKRFGSVVARLSQLVSIEPGTTVVPWIAQRGAVSFLNRDYRMVELPGELLLQPRIVFDGGEGDRIMLRFTKPAVVFAAFEYNSTGAWSFPEGLAPQDFGWRLVTKNGYRGTSNADDGGTPHFAHVYCRAFAAGERLGSMPPWWVCLGIVDPKTAARIAEDSEGEVHGGSVAEPLLYGRWASRPRPLRAPDFQSAEQWSAWQQSMREAFRRRLIFKYDKPPTIEKVGEPTEYDHFTRQEFHALSDGRRLFRFFKLTPRSSRPAGGGRRWPTIVCFMGHGKVRQILEEQDSYQHACAAQFAKRGYLVYAMENVGMEPSRDRHLELDRVLRLDGYGWYSLLFAHQQILLDFVFADPAVDTSNVGVTGVSTGGLLALSAVATDTRIKAASVHGIFGSMRVSFIRDRNRHCSCGAIPGLLPDFDLPVLALLAAPRALHFSNATADGFTPAEAKRCVRLITPLYRKAGGSEPRFSEPLGRHEFAFGPALQFFEDTMERPNKID